MKKENERNSVKKLEKALFLRKFTILKSIHLWYNTYVKTMQAEKGAECMNNPYVEPIYSRIFNETFDRHEFSHRLKMQKMVYMLQGIGVPVGEYGFTWYKHGPYSQKFANEMLYDTEAIQVPISDLDKDNIELIDKLSSVLNNTEVKYSQQDWIECVGSLYYIKQNFCGFDVPDNIVMKKLAELKPHLKYIDDNKIALSLCKELIGW